MHKIIIILITFFLYCLCIKLKNEVDKLRYENSRLKYGKTAFSHGYLTKWEKREWDKFNKITWTEACKGKMGLYDIADDVRYKCIVGDGMTANQAFKVLLKEYEARKKHIEELSKNTR